MHSIMSNLAEIIAEVEKLPERERMVLFDRLIQMKCSTVKKSRAPYILNPVPLGIRSDVLPSHLLEQMDEENFTQKYQHKE
jgi:hypothetical protein